MSLLVALAATLLLAASLPRRCYAQLCSDPPFNTEALVNIGYTNYTTYTICTTISSSACIYQYGLVYNDIFNCQSNGYIALIAPDNSICCSPCCDPSGPVVVSNSSSYAPGGATTLTPANIGANISCDGYDGPTAPQCLQLRSEAQSACQVCVNAGAGCAITSDNLVVCSYPPSSQLVETYYGSIFADGYDCAYGLDVLISPYLDDWLQLTTCWWLTTVDQNGAIAGYVYWSDAELVVNTIQNGCGVMATGPGPCSGNGVCTTGYAQTYCLCNEGWQGPVCDEQVPDGASPCDCGVSWELTLLGSLGPLQGYTLTVVLASATAAATGGGPWVPVGSLEQAQNECYVDVRCDG